ncbi:MAG: hypothetical protein AAFY78_24870 [Cyanobacteria bacterium J06648_16]
MHSYQFSTNGLKPEQEFELHKFAAQLEAAPPSQLRAMLLDAMRQNMVQRNVISRQAQSGAMPDLAGVLGQMG